MTLEEFVKKHEIVMMRVTGTTPAPWKEEAGYQSNHWIITFTRPGRSFTCDFWTGSGIKEDEIDAAFVLESMFMDVPILEMTFEEFCDDFGYSTDSRKAYKTWEDTIAYLIRLKEFLEPKGLKELGGIDGC